MDHLSPEGKLTASDSGSLIVLFRPPAHRFRMTGRLCDQYGSVVDLQINGQSLYTNEAPMVVQPDYLVDNHTGQIVGLTYELPSPTWMLPRCKEMLRELDANAIRLSGNGSETIWMDVIWSETDSFKRVHAQLDYGLWAFLYAVKEPYLLQNGDVWTPPAGIVIGDLDQLGLVVSISVNETGDTTIEPMRQTED
ncbi:hypothetical protein [Rubinisphaera brasiliensis]|uniref:Uncharacterized protein n=1 Tax=Rubinisphaera brasiliensis (strain ATCC 49424 / DSM 5305 / JCM 21570 / IAM 15109 / NBRC 103401 / IFAM 1448) TaxID=756272 RepID=F0SQD4_RUBBR|nr:hypothetical protein [Rubinisphaera brasiliensis]ADY62313.1 hypothetical protein Plabr_4742 [Rubinisphaera brasiliensis DSM 5305]